MDSAKKRVNINLEVGHVPSHRDHFFCFQVEKCDTDQLMNEIFPDENYNSETHFMSVVNILTSSSQFEAEKIAGKIESLISVIGGEAEDYDVSVIPDTGSYSIAYVIRVTLIFSTEIHDDVKELKIIDDLSINNGTLKITFDSELPTDYYDISKYKSTKENWEFMLQNDKPLDTRIELSFEGNEDETNDALLKLLKNSPHGGLIPIVMALSDVQLSLKFKSFKELTMGKGILKQFNFQRFRGLLLLMLSKLNSQQEYRNTIDGLYNDIKDNISSIKSFDIVFFNTKFSFNMEKLDLKKLLPDYEVFKTLKPIETDYVPLRPNNLS